MHLSSAQRLPTVAELTEHLFDVYRHPSQRKYSNREVETEIPGSIKHVNIYKIRVGQIPNPSRESLLVFCRFFHMSPLYFFPELWNGALVGAFWRCEATGFDPDCPHIRLHQHSATLQA